MAALVVQDTWAESHKRVLDQEQLMAEKDEYAAALWFFDLMQRVAQRYVNSKRFELEPSFAFHKQQAVTEKC